jgi:5-formaminoimidazole-4-carboxamide-1-beta-D-ribofuranosyl 5'-monophosphate synthetase
MAKAEVKKGYFFKSTDELTEIYIKGLRHYVKNRLGETEMHMEDFAVEAANFAECFYATIQALPSDNR